MSKNNDKIELKVKKFIPRGAEEWSRGEIKRLRKYLVTKHGAGPRAQQLVQDELRTILTATKDERRTIRATRLL